MLKTIVADRFFKYSFCFVQASPGTFLRFLILSFIVWNSRLQNPCGLFSYRAPYCIRPAGDDSYLRSLAGGPAGPAGPWHC